MHDLYAEAWHRLSMDRDQCPDIEAECTPVLAFGQWQSSRVASVGLNPSEDEFRDKARRPLVGDKQRFLHWPEDHTLTQQRLQVALERAEHYFTLGNDYEWFKDYQPFLGGLGVSFAEGTACHTDYLSPFATRVGIGGVSSATWRRLAAFGHGCWTGVLGQMPNLELLIGHGRGWQIVPALLRMSRWTEISTQYDAKGGRTKTRRPFLLSARATLPASKRDVLVYWWRPNPDGAPLAWLRRDEKLELGAYVREHAYSQGFLQ